MSEPSAIAQPSALAPPPRQGHFRRWSLYHPRGVDFILAGILLVTDWFWIIGRSLANPDNLTTEGQLAALTVTGATGMGSAMLFLTPFYDISAHFGWVGVIVADQAALAVEIAGLLLWRRSAPLWFYGATIVGGSALMCLMPFTQTLTPATALSMLLAVWAIARWTDPKTATLAWVIGNVAQLILEARLATGFWALDWNSSSEADLTNAGWFVGTELGYFAFAMVGGLVTILLARRSREQALWMERAERLELEREQALQWAVAAERREIAREMHDIVSHSLTVMVSLTSGSARLIDTQPERAKEAIEEAAATGRQALADMRRMVGVLREGSVTEAAALEPQPGGVDLWKLADTFRTAGLPVALSVTGDLPADPVVALTVYRIVQEALTNTLRYAGAPTQVTADVTTAPRLVTVDVADNGTGRPGASVGAGQGLVGLRERVALFGGTLEAGPRPEGGWRVRATLNLEEATP
ncbi:MAG: histidine kinase [Propionibacteriaceae bacterium]|nr:histidine kinase [Propionibacteriaceae bacterium]